MRLPKPAGCAFVGLVLVGCASVRDDGRVSWAKVENDRLAYVEAGRGDPVIFVHGGLQDYRLWSEHLPAFARRYRAIAYSRRNHHPNAVDTSGAPDGAAELHAVDLAAFVEDLELGPVHVVAHSAGAHAALFFAASRPDLVRTLTVNEPPAMGLLAASPDGQRALADFSAQLVLARDAFRRGSVNEGLRLFVDAVGGPGAHERRSVQTKLMMADNASAHLADATTTRPRPVFTCELARRIGAPTLVTRGERSPAVFHRVADELVRCLPRASSATIPEASHSAPAEAPAAFRAAVLAFLHSEAR